MLSSIGFHLTSFQAGNDDIDFNEIFAEYFSNELDIDPLHAYTGAMANQGPVVNIGSTVPAGITSSQVHQFSGSETVHASRTVSSTGTNSSMPPVVNPLNLPTGGIRTSFHGAHIKRPLSNYEAQGDAKKQKYISSTGTRSAFPIQNIQAAESAAQAASIINAQNTLAQNLASAQSKLSNTGAIQLPVGVGIRLGGIGGIAPASAQHATSNFPAFAGAMNIAGRGDPDQSTQVAEERRQRNREHAKRSRVRKKFMLESMQEEVKSLQRENQSLRLLVQEHMPEDAMRIISECCTGSHLFDDDLNEKSGTVDYGSEGMVSADQILMKSLSMGQQNFVLSDPKLPDNPIVFASPGFYKLTGYTSEEVLGRNCRFLQGPGTDQKAVDVIRKAVETGSDASVCLLNYKSDGTPFWNQFFIGALRDSDNRIVNFVGVQTEVHPEVSSTVLEEKVNAVMPLSKDGEE